LVWARPVSVRRSIEAVTRAYLKIIDSANRMEIGELAAVNAKDGPPR